MNITKTKIYINIIYQKQRVVYLQRWKTRNNFRETKSKK